MVRIILDVGSRNGESLEEFVRWGFDVIHAFEPMPGPFANIVATYGDDPRVEAHNYGLSDHTGTMPVYGSDAVGEASVFASKVDLDSRVVTECAFVDVADVFDGFADASVFVKLNCEGSEVAILNRLIDTGHIDRIEALRVEFDISRCPGHEHEADEVIARLAEVGFDRLTIGSNARLTPAGLVDDVQQVGVHADRMRAWLEASGAPCL
jgi:FkbM family methyltransferase